MKRTRENADKTKQLIIETSYEVFKSVGYDNASLVDIAKNANLTRGALYWHFKDKRALYEYIVRLKLSEIIEEKENLFDDENCSLKELITNLLKVHIKDSDKYFFINQMVYLRLFHQELNDIATEIDDVKRVYFDKLELFIKNKINPNNELDDALCQRITSFIYTLFEGIHIYNLQKARGEALTENDIDLYMQIIMIAFNDIFLNNKKI